ncbi:MAG: ATP-binding protein, partial [Gemmataceae bacterium]
MGYELELDKLETVVKLASQVEGEEGARLRGAVQGLAHSLQEARQQIHEMSSAQADALVNAAMLMTELKEMKDQAESLRVKAEFANQAKTQFLASMSHELRTPLNAILALSEALLEKLYGPLNEQQTAALGDIQKGGSHLLALINDILDLFKIEAGHGDIDLTAFQVEPMCQEALQMVKNGAYNKRLQVSTSFDPKINAIHADRRRMKQILVNLLSNAFKFTPVDGSVNLEVTGDVAANQIRFTVSDSGIGIRAEDMRSLFQPFHQIDSRLSREYAGTGLGLVLVKRMAELHGGDVAIESEPGKGSRFTVTIPWKPADLPMVTPAPGKTLIPVRKIFLVEDSLVEATKIRRYLESMGIELVLQTVIEGAPERIRAERPNLVMLDIQLPDGDGWDVLASMKQDPELAKIPAVISSIIDDRDKAKKLGAFDLIVKPISRETLEGLVDRLGGKTSLSDGEFGVSSAGLPPLVLHADDDPVNGRVVRDALQSQGYRVESVLDGKSAIEAALRLKPQLILMDIQMPGMDGL